MARDVEEWRSDNPKAMPPPRVKARILERFADDEGVPRCAECGRAFDHRNKPEFDHAVAIINGGENREFNIQPLCESPCHEVKTGQDVKIKSKRAKVTREKYGLETKRSSFRTSRAGPYKAKIGGGIVRREEE